MTQRFPSDLGNSLPRTLCLVCLWLFVGFGSRALAQDASPTQSPTDLRIVTLDSPSSLVHLQVVIQSGAAADPAGRQGLANLTANLLIDGSFGEPVVTKDDLAEMTRPWGEGAYPRVTVSKETTTLSMVVPQDALPEFCQRVLGPMLTQPKFDAGELKRLRGETLQSLKSMRLEEIELAGLYAMDWAIHEGTSYAHPNFGTESGLGSIEREDVVRFFQHHYQPHNLVVGVSSSSANVLEPIREALGSLNRTSPGAAHVTLAPPPNVHGRDLTIISLPNAISTGIHAGFPLRITRADDDYWPLYVANIHFGTHRDGFGQLYQAIRQDRGYNYGDYSYIEHFAGRPFVLFPPTNTPRRYQYFSIWIRPVQHEYAHHILKALTFELEDFIRNGLTDEECQLAKNKAQVLYLSLAETTGRILGYRMDDQFYQMNPGYLKRYLERIDAVTTEEVNAAIKRHLQVKNMRYLVMTDKSVAEQLAQDVAAGKVAWGKPPQDYQIPSQDGPNGKSWLVAPDKLPLLQKDAAWAHFWLDIPQEQIRILPAEELFR